MRRLCHAPRTRRPVATAVTSRGPPTATTSTTTARFEPGQPPRTGLQTAPVLRTRTPRQPHQPPSPPTPTSQPPPGRGGISSGSVINPPTTGSHTRAEIPSSPPPPLVVNVVHVVAGHNVRPPPNVRAAARVHDQRRRRAVHPPAVRHVVVPVQREAHPPPRAQPRDAPNVAEAPVRLLPRPVAHPRRVVDGDNEEAGARVDGRGDRCVGRGGLCGANGAARLKCGRCDARVEAHQRDGLVGAEELDVGEARLPRQPVLVL